jgi:hypothetical protein
VTTMVIVKTKAIVTTTVVMTTVATKVFGTKLTALLY